MSAVRIIVPPSVHRVQIDISPTGVSTTILDIPDGDFRLDALPHIGVIVEPGLFTRLPRREQP